MEEKTKLKKAKEWFENKKIIVVLVIIFIVYVAIAQIFKSTQDIKESVDQLGASATEQQDEPISKLEQTKGAIQLSGKVVNVDNQSLRQAKIEIVGWNGAIEYTDENGNFLIEQFQDPLPASAEIMITKEDHRTYTQKINLSHTHQQNLGRIILQAQNTPVNKTTKLNKPSPQPSEKKEASSKGDIIFEKNTFNGAVINNPSGTININTQTKSDTTRNE